MFRRLAGVFRGEPALQDQPGCHVDFFREDVVSGWAWRQDRPQERVRLELLADDAVVGEVVADVFREDLKAAGIGDGCYGFTFRLPAAVAKTSAISIRPEGRAWAAIPLTRDEALLPTEFGIDVFNDQVIEGWTRRPYQPEQRVELEFLADDTVIGEVVADIYRADLKAAGKGDGRHAFVFNLPPVLHDGRLRTIGIRRKGGGELLHVTEGRVFGNIRNDVVGESAGISFLKALPAEELARVEIGEGHAQLGPGLTVVGWAFGGSEGEPAGHLLAVEGLSDRFPLETLPVTSAALPAQLPSADIGFEGWLPGRVWLCEDGTSRDTLRLQVLHNGVACGGAPEIAKADIVLQVEAISANNDLERDYVPILLALEHIRFGRLWNLLSEQARAFYAQAADFYRLSDLLRPTSAAGEDPQLTAKAVAPVRPAADQLLVARVRSAFVTAVRQDPSIDIAALLDDAIGPFPKPRFATHVRQDLYFSLVDLLCTRRKFEILYMRAAAEGLAHFSPRNESWFDSTILPFLYMSREFKTVSDIMWRLGEDPAGWVATPAISWVVRSATRSTVFSVPEEVRDGIIYAFMSLVNKRANDYWGLVPCIELIDTTVELLKSIDGVPEYLARDLRSFALRSYGLSRHFWRRVRAARDAGELTLSAEMRTAEAAFCEIESRFATDPETLSSAVRVFEAFGTADVERVRLELFGPAGVPVASPQTLLAAVIEEGRNPEESVLRHLAAPGVAGTAPELIEIARNAVRERYNDCGRLDYHRLQGQLSRDIAAFGARLGAGAVPAREISKEVERFLSGFGVLISRRGHFIGLRMAVALFLELMRNNQAAAAERIIAYLHSFNETFSEEERNILRWSPSLRSALARLGQWQKARGDDLSAALLDFFNERVPGLAALLEESAAAPGSPGNAARGAKAAAVGKAPAEKAIAFDDASALFDILVVVYSCRAKLDTNVAAMRKSWLHRLDELGIPYIVAVGGGHGEKIGDTVYLDCPDDYEGLPQKTLAAFRWVYENTNAGFALKIDDDCFLNVEEYFHSHSYAISDYFGRVLRRTAGQTDRIWHQQKSSTDRGRFELDKSPEPSVYADGGSAYSLSRRAMKEVMFQSQTPAGRRLIASSFMEDKMIGDLLAKSNIFPDNFDYYVSILRRPRPGAQAVSRWANSFYPSRAAPIKLIHLDCEELQVDAAACLPLEDLKPKKIWPTYQSTRLLWNSNAIDLVSDEAKLRRLNEAPVAVVACMRNERFILPYFLDHYRAMGVEAFLIADNLSDDGTQEYLAAQPDVALFSVDTDYSLSQYGVAWQQALLAHFRVGRWSLVADGDEFLVCDFERKTRLPDLLKTPEFRDADAARIFMLDMYPKGRLDTATFKSGDLFAEAGYCEREPFLAQSAGRGPYSNSETYTSALRHRLLPNSRPELFVAQKIALLKYSPFHRLSAGLHYIGDVDMAGRDLIFAHFKYHAAFFAKAQEEVQRRQHYNNAEEYRRYLQIAAEGRDVIFEAGTSVPWMECDFVRSRLGPPPKTA